MTMKTLRIATMAALTTVMAGCYAVPVQVEAGKPTLYAYSPVPVQPVIGPQAPAYPSATAASYTPVAATTLHVRLYPMNDAAARFGAMQGAVMDTQSGRGSFSLQTTSELMLGEATRVPDSFPGFGRVLLDVLGGEAVGGTGSRRGVANAHGTRGMYANCEYVISSGNMGTGACVFSNGARYQIHFGG